MIKVVIDKSKGEVVRRENIHVYDESGNEIKLITKVAIFLDAANPAKLVLETLDFEFDGQFYKDDVEIVTKKAANEDTAGV